MMILNKFNKKKIFFQSISPGVVNTDIFEQGFQQLLDPSAHILNPEDVSQSIMFALATPPHVQIHEIKMQAVGEIL